MAFTWRTITKGQSILKVQDFNRIHEATDVLATNLGVSQYSWTLFPLSQGEKIRVSHLDELRTGLDYIDDENYCSGQNAAVTQNVEEVARNADNGDLTDNSGDDGSENSGQLVGDQASDQAVENSSQLSNEATDNTDNSGQLAGNDVGDDGSENSGQLAGNDVGDDGAQNTTNNNNRASQQNDDAPNNGTNNPSQDSQLSNLASDKCDRRLKEKIIYL